MEERIKKSLSKGFTIARWGMDMCLGALFIAAAFLIQALMKGETDLLKRLLSAFVVCVLGILVFAAGRVMIGLQSRKLYLHTNRPLTEEERWFVGCMLEMEETGAGTNFWSSAARVSGSKADDIAAGAAASAIIGRFFKIGKRYMSRSLLLRRLPAIVFLAAAVIIVMTGIL